MALEQDVVSMMFLDLNNITKGREEKMSAGSLGSRSEELEFVLTFVLERKLLRGNFVVFGVVSDVTGVIRS